MGIEGVGIPLAGVARAAELLPAHRANAPAAAAPAEAVAEAPTLMELLTPAERAFFARIESLGPLTYRPGTRPAASQSAPTGQRIDVKG